MNRSGEHIRVFEYDTLRHDKGEVRISKEQFDAFQSYFGNGCPYYTLVYNGIKFNKYVGVIQIGNTLIEVLPKADIDPEVIKCSQSTEVSFWHDRLIDMMRTVGSFDIRVTSKASLRIKPNTILDLYIEKFLNEVEYLLHSGLVKKYRQTESNVTSLKGSLVFSRDISQNLTHRERFYVHHSTYDIEHQLHFILYTALKFIRQINTNASLHSRIGALLLYFPEMPVIKVSEATFNSIIYNRKTEGYRTAIEIARMLLLQYHPDIIKGRNNVLALMFDMNRLWEQFIYVSLKQYAPELKINQKPSKDFWRPEIGRKSIIEPDIVVNNSKTGSRVVLDTKWKNLNDYNPSPEDLRQMYVYHEYFHAQKTALVYPGLGNIIQGSYFSSDLRKEEEQMQCSVMSIKVEPGDVREWQKAITTKIMEWIHPA